MKVVFLRRKGLKWGIVLVVFIVLLIVILRLL